MADLVQFSHNVATVLCPLGPRIMTLIGRVDDPYANPTGLIPEVNQTAAQLDALFLAKSTSAEELVALLGAHSVGQQFYQDPTLAGEPFDTTPGIWDVSYYSQVLAGAPSA
jgi:manganese peroxidase